jgi:hypothetical protein
MADLRQALAVCYLLAAADYGHAVAMGGEGLQYVLAKTHCWC